MTWKMLKAAALAAVISTLAPSVYATEGNGQYPNGAEDFMVGAAPYPGVYFTNYLNYYTAGQLNNNSGDKRRISASIDALTEMPRLLYMSNTKILGANWGAHVMVPLVNLNYSIGSSSGNQFSLGDIVVDPFILSWRFPNFHVNTGLDIYMPTGQYDRTKPVNAGANYWGFEPLIAATYLSDSGFEASAKLMYAFNTRNNATDYLSGRALHTDYLLAQHWNHWAAGLGGYWFQQTVDDNIKGVGDVGNRGMVFAAGPAVKYDANVVSLTGKWLHELTAENRPEGDSFWFKFNMRF